MSEYLRFERHLLTGHKTPKVLVYNKRSGGLLGVIHWFSRWRQFVFAPSADTVFNVDCMTDIQDQIDVLRREREAARKRASKCEWCGDSPGHYVCREADRSVFPCSNYVAGDDEGDRARQRYGYVRP